jgi:hypothetical protein
MTTNDTQILNSPKRAVNRLTRRCSGRARRSLRSLVRPSWAQVRFAAQVSDRGGGGRFLAHVFHTGATLRRWSVSEDSASEISSDEVLPDQTSAGMYYDSGRANFSMDESAAKVRIGWQVGPDTAVVTMCRSNARPTVRFTLAAPSRSGSPRSNGSCRGAAQPAVAADGACAPALNGRTLARQA